MLRFCGVTSVACAATMLAACGSDSPTATPAASTAHGTLAVSPPLRVIHSAADFMCSASGRSPATRSAT